MTERLDVPLELLAELRTLCLALPDAYEEEAWVGTRWRIRTHTFAHVLTIDRGWPPAYARAAADDGPTCVLMFRSRGDELASLRSTGHPFFAPRWRADEVGMVLDAKHDPAEVAELITESYRILAPRKLADLVSGPPGPTAPTTSSCGERMAKLIYSAITSLDGSVNDADGAFDWSVPDEAVHAFVNDLERSVGTYLYGRRMYEVMVAWKNAPTTAGDTEPMLDFARIWQAADKVVYSTTLPETSSDRTRIERDFDPAAVERMKTAATRDISVGGPGLAASAIRAGLVDECHLFVSPIVVGGGTRALPDGVRWELELVGEQRFENGVVHLHYADADLNAQALSVTRRIAT